MGLSRLVETWYHRTHDYFLLTGVLRHRGLLICYLHVNVVVFKKGICVNRKTLSPIHKSSFKDTA